ncbi:hypothetical protein SEPCBS119000_006380 [Sporothrix epigloea]|uniref:AB hydrolase-1 domain-containing protein n=1 Tax=Sporothrix epigloea TaxID=1892477 RepID=A0ABP0E408_9PEZI
MSSSSSSDPAVQRDSQSLTLSDGRKLGFAEYGVPDGHPVIYLHGFPSNRLEGVAFDKAAKKHKIRLLSLDRPGYGLSTLQPGRQMLDWPDDVLAFAKAQSISTFGVLGASGGGPYVLACARKLPPTALTHVGIACGSGDFSPASRQAGVIPRRSLWTEFMVKRWPWGFRCILGGIVGLAHWIVRTKVVTRWIDSWLVKMDEQAAKRQAEAQAADKKDAVPADASALKRSEGSVDSFERASDASASVESLSTIATKSEPSAAVDADNGTPKRTIPERREAMLRGLFDTFAQGYQGTLEDARVLASDYGFQYEDIQFDPVMFWHGDKDVNTPLPWIKLIADRLPHATLKVYPGKTHYSLTEEMDEMIAHFSTETAAKEEAIVAA